MPLPLLLEGRKRPRQRQVVAQSPPVSATEQQLLPPANLLYLEDQLSSLRFLENTRAAVSVFPQSSAGKPSSCCLAAADGNRIPSWRTHLLPLKFSSRRFEWTFVLAKVDRPFFWGDDFLPAHGLIVDLQGGQLLDSATMTPLPTSYSDVVPRILLPVQFRRAAFDAIHGISHPSVRATRQLISKRYLNADVSTWAKDCLSCQAAKVTRHQRSEVQTIPCSSQEVFAHPHGPFGPSQVLQRILHPPHHRGQGHPLA